MADYQDVIQNPQICFNDQELKLARATLSPLGLPIPISGGNASVYQLTSGAHRWAVRCFLSNRPDQQQRYEAIAQALAAAALPYSVKFIFEAKGIFIPPEWYPIIRMEWLDAKRLNEHVQGQINSPTALRTLASDWKILIERLRAKSIAHGDLQHGNILVDRNGSMRLIDYDGMYVPALAGHGSHETGHPAYRHPNRKGSDFGPEIDRFSALLIHTAIRAIAEKPELWAKFNNDDNMLFRQDDLAHPGEAPVFAAIRAIGQPSLSNAALSLQAACLRPIADVPTLDEAQNISLIPVSVLNQLRAAAVAVTTRPQAASFTFTAAWTRPGYRYDRHVRQEPIFETRTHRVRKQEKYRVFLIFEQTREVEVDENYQFQTGTRSVEEHVPTLVSGHTGAIAGVAMKPDGSVLVSAGEDGSGIVWDSAGNRLAMLGPHEKQASGVAIAGSRIVTSSWDWTARVWTTSGTPTRVLTSGNSSRVYSVAMSPDGRRVAGGLGYTQVKIWDADSGREIAVLRGHSRKVLAVAFFGSGARVASASADMTVRIWDVARAKSDAVLFGHTDQVTTLAISPKGDLIASGGDDGTIFLWDTRTATQRLRITARDASVGALCFAPNGQYLLSGGTLGAIRFFDVVSGRQVKELAGHAGAIRGIAMSADGTKLFSGDDRGQLIRWAPTSAASPASVRTLPVSPPVAPPRPAAPTPILRTPICPRDGSQLVLRHGKYGSFWGCSRYPRCTFTRGV